METLKKEKQYIPARPVEQLVSYKVVWLKIQRAVRNADGQTGWAHQSAPLQKPASVKLE